VGDPNVKVTAGEYWLIRGGALATQIARGVANALDEPGLGGLGWMPVLPWSTAWQA
jgi:hypothetical protein